MTKFKLNKNWSIQRETDDELILSAGQDAVYTIDIEPGKSFFETVGYRSFERQGLSLKDLIVFEQLLSADIIQPILTKTPLKTPEVCEISDDKSFKLLASNSKKNYDLAVLIRTRMSMQDFYRHIDYAQIDKPHLFVDLTFHHIISIGPLVFPGATACLGCLQGRITIRWGDPAPPAQTKASTELKKIAGAVLELEIKKVFEEEDFFLVNRVAVLDTTNRTWENNKLLRVPVCPYCEKHSKDQPEFLNTKIDS